MKAMDISVVLFIILVIWLFVVTVLIIKLRTFFNTLSKDLKVENITGLLQQIFKNQERNQKSIEEFQKQIEYFAKQQETHMQKYGFVRFNPFGDMGGDHSFCLTLLDGRNTGFILTGLHTRERTRVYVKYIKRSKSEYDLSKEEKKSLELALHKNV